QNVEVFVLIVHDFDWNTMDGNATLNELRSIIQYIKIFKQLDECVDYEQSVEIKTLVQSVAYKTDHHENIRDIDVVQLYTTPHPAHTTSITSSSLISTTSSWSLKSIPIITQSN
ncbi:unnamed protein product, partial [Didymodactylos carnosus]